MIFGIRERHLPSRKELKALVGSEGELLSMPSLNILDISRLNA
jgi:hypothetical protein